MIKSKKIISIVAATLTLSAFALSGCGDKAYKGEAIDGYVSAAAVSSNGGFVVEKGDYVYFVNGKEDSTANNTYGDVKKGALLRISKADLAAGKEGAAKVVVPSLFVTGNYDSGIYIYGDYVYYATPTTDKNNDGQVANSSLDFKRAKLDGTEAPMAGKDKYFFRLSSNTTKYRFVQEGDVVYCLYEEDGQLKSYNTVSDTTTVLVKGASTFYYDTQDLSNPTVYYAMSVSQGIDQPNATAQKYNQIFSVSAAATVEVDTAAASYKAKDGAGKVVAQYDFDEKYLKENAKEKEYDLKDYTTYPYVNLGQLVLDGIGSMHDFPSHVVMTDAEKAVKEQAAEFGYTYTLQQQTNGGLYFTRALVNAGSDEKAKLCYIPSARTDWNAITGNGAGKTQIVATDTTSASASALYEINEGVHSYLYLSDSVLKRATTNEQGLAMETVTLAHGVSSITLWKTVGDYLYYYADGTNGKNLSRINYKGTKDNYGFNETNEDEYKPVTLSLVDWSDSWYKPEFVVVGEKTLLLYPNAQSFGAGSTAYNYVYATEVGSTEQIKARNEKIEEVNDYIDGYSSNTAVQALMKCYFRTGNGATYDTDTEVQELYKSHQVKAFEEFKALFAKDGKFENAFERNFLYAIGTVKDEDAEAIADDWANSLLTVTEEEEEEGLPTWAWVLIITGASLVVLAAILIPVIIVSVKKKKSKKKQAESIVNAYKHKKLDTTDDKSIDVYADEEPTETPVENEKEETAEENSEETETTQNEGAEEAQTEVAEAPVEEAKDAPTEE